MAKTAKIKARVFVVAPIGDDKSPERRRSDAVLKRLIYPALNPKPLKIPRKQIRRADEIAHAESITATMVQELGEAALVIVNLDGLNPNVMFEFGVLKAWGRPVVAIAPAGLTRPFNVSDINVVPYPDLTTGKCVALKRAIGRLRERAKEAIAGHQADDYYKLAHRSLTRGLISLEVVYQGKAWTVRHLLDDLQKQHDELRNDWETKSKTIDGQASALKHFSELLKELFEDFGSELRVYKRLVLDVDSPEQNNPHCRRVCRLMDKLLRDGWSAIQHLHGEPSTPISVMDAEGLLETMIENCREILTEIKRQKTT